METRKMKNQHPLPAKPRVFVGSSSEGKEIAENVQLGMKDDFEVTLWWQGVVEISKSSMGSFDKITRDFDFGILVLTPDDISSTRGSIFSIPRDNVIFELGLLIGGLGRERTFVVCPSDEPLKLPSDFEGVTTARYKPRRDGNLQAALRPVCNQIKREIRRIARLSPSGAPKPVKSRAKKRPVERRRRRRSLGTAHTTGPRKDLRVINISASGALLETQGEMPINQLLDLNIELENGKVAQATARVVRVQYPEWGQVGGVGVSFTSLKGNSVDILKSYIEEDLIAT
jgi:hypothetical protein